MGSVLRRVPAEWSLPARLGGSAAARPFPPETSEFDGRRVLARLLRLAPRAAAAAATAVLLLAVGLLAFRASYGDRIYPAIAVADVPVGGLDQAAARERLEDRAAALTAQTVTFAHGDRTWAATLGELGASVDVEASLAEAHGLGREDEALDRLQTTAGLARADRTVPLRARLDVATLERWLDAVDADFARTPRDAAVSVRGTEVTVEPEVEGIVVDRAGVHGRVLAAMQGYGLPVEPLPAVATAPAVRAADLADAQARIQAALARPLRVTLGRQRWEIAAQDLGPFVVQRVDPNLTGAAAVALDLDEEGLTDWLTGRFAPEINRDPVDAVVAWNEGVVAIEPSADGVRIKPRTFARAVTAAFWGDEGTLEVPVKVTKPTVDSDNLGDLGITTQIGRGDSNYSGGTPDRNTNVQVGAGLLNGTLVPPGAEFSFNRAIGEITPDKGYVESTVVEAERAGRDIGGGICQVSTTAFRAALLSGLPITEWWPHTYRILGYEHDGWGPGFDASILQPEGDPFGGGDFRFANPTDSWLLVESWTDGTYVVVTIYGPDLGYDVRIGETNFIGPDPTKKEADLEVVDYELPPGSVQQTEWPLSGSEAAFVREVYAPGGELVESREFYTRFRGRGNIWRVSPDMVGQSPAAG